MSQFQSQGDFNRFVKEALQHDPIGKTIDELVADAPHGVARTEIEDALRRFEEHSRVQKIGDKWRWTG